jgi:hypothetical protein
MAITPIMTSPTIAGKVLYLELVNNPDPEAKVSVWYKDAVKQVIVFPQSLDDVGIVKPPMIWSRTVSSRSPRSQWDTTNLGQRSLIKPPTPEDLEAKKDNYHYSYDTYSVEEVDAMTPERKAEVYAYTLGEKLKGMVLEAWVNHEADGSSITQIGQSWVIRDSKPLAIEFTDEEIAQALAGETPQGLIRRLKKARVSAGFPEKIA